jgi:NitT/TauT family transport system permease protein
MGCFRSIEAIFLPPLSFLAKIPPTAMIAIFLALEPWLRGLQVPLPVAVVVFGILPTLTQAIFQMAREDVPDELIYKAFTLGASQPEIIWDVIVRYVLPRMLEAVRLQVGPAMVYLIAIEWIYSDDGFGYRLRIQQRLLNMSVVYVYLAFLGIAGYLIDLALSGTRRLLCPWYGKAA